MADVEKREMIVDFVHPELRDWQGKSGTIYFVTVNFADRTQGSVLCGTKALAEEVQGVLEGLRNTSGEFSLEADGEYKGTKKWRIKGFPGMPANVSGGGGGGGKGGGGGMSHAQAGLMAAASLMSGNLTGNLPDLDATNPDHQDIIVGATLEIAERFTDHLFTRRSGEQAADKGGDGSMGGAPPPTAASASDSITIAQMKRIRELAETRGVDDIPKTIGVNTLGDLSAVDADALIAAWG